jgi:hypothetical protein
MFFFKKTTLIIIITVIILELIGLILSSLRIIPNGSPAVMSLFADKKLTYWHPKNITFKNDYNTCWGPSKVTYNNIGSRSTKDVKIKKTKKRIGLLSDSMVDMIHVNDGEDITSLLQANLPNYEIINFSARGTGLYDHLEVYKNLVKAYNVDYLILLPTQNDLENNFISSNRPDEIFSQPKFYIDKLTNKIIKIDRNKKKFDDYFSKKNRLKRSKFVLYLKEYSQTFRIYLHFKVLFRSNKIKKNSSTYDEEDFTKDKELLKDQKKIYKYIFKDFINEIEKDSIKLITVLNLRKQNFVKEENLPLKEKIELYQFNILKDIWTSYNNAYYDLDEAKKFIELNSAKIVKPYEYMGHVCDDHYSKYGAKYISNVIIKLINKN